jgi:hypothetical protein
MTLTKDTGGQRCCVKGCRRMASMIVTPVVANRPSECLFFAVCLGCKNKFPNVAVWSVIPERKSRAKSTN